MGENVCCPFLKVQECSDTKEHKHLYCDPYYILNNIIIENDWVKVYCLREFANCKYYPRGEE